MTIHKKSIQKQKSQYYNIQSTNQSNNHLSSQLVPAHPMRPMKYNKSKKAPAFISHLYNILADPSNHPFIKWQQDEESFIILNIPRFSETVLPKFYKHSNYSSFVRQLNMYNFSKMRSELEGEHVFRNELFVKDGEDNLRSIRRREIVNNGTSNNGKSGSNNSNSANSILSLAHALSSQLIQSQSSDRNLQIDLIDSSSEPHDHLLEAQIAAPTPEHSFLSEFPNIENLRLLPFVSQYLEETDKIPPTLQLKPETLYFPIKSKIDQMKDSQNQLEEICISLYKQNQVLTGQNKKLQERLKSEFKKKEQILSQIIKYVVNFLSEWNANSTEVDEEKDWGQKEHVFSDQESLSDAVIDSYEKVEKRKFEKTQNGSDKQSHSRKQNGFTFSKYAQNEKKILLTLLKEIEKSYNQKYFFTQGNYQTTPPSYDGKKSKPHQSYPSSSSTPNNFLMSMLLSFIESNNLAEVIKRFSLLINLQRNKKSKNFTVVNCMKDLKEHFEMKELEKEYGVEEMGGEEGGLERFVDKERFLENQKETIKEMEKQLALMTNPKTKSKELMLLEKQFFQCSENQSSHMHLTHDSFSQRQKLINSEFRTKRQVPPKKVFQSPYFFCQQKQEINPLSDFEDKTQKQILEKFSFRLE